MAIYIFLLVMAGLAQAATITVGPKVAHDFDTIQAGIDAAVDGDKVLVAPGEYVITEPITFRGKAITVKSEAGPDETTIRMGTPTDTNRGSVIIFENSETDASILEGFTITGGTGYWVSSVGAYAGGGILFDASSGNLRNCAIVQNNAKYGGGVIVYSGASTTLTNCTIAENSADDAGGGVFCYENSSMTMTDCIITDNSAAGGGGVHCWIKSSVTMTNCIISGNSSEGGLGGGAFCGGDDSSKKSSLTMTDCIISGNSSRANGGGGVACWYGYLTLTRCAILKNTGGYYFGGGVYAGHSSATLNNCVIARNTAAQGGGGVCSSYADAFVTISNCTIWGNSAGSECGGGGVLCRNASATVTNSIVWGNTSAKGREISVQDPASNLTIAYSNIAGGQSGVSVEGGCTLNWGEGNIDINPLFTDPNDDDYHLKSQAGRWTSASSVEPDPSSQTWIMDDVTSPCIDAGDPNSDWSAELWPHGERINMGAYGGILQASRSLSDAGNIADLNRDGIVDSADMRIMVDHWGTDEPLCDISPAPFGDGAVDVQDLVVLAENLFEDYRMIAHWKLDETEGSIAYDSIGKHHGTLYGEPVWQPTTGQVNGALEFDGVDDYVSTDFILDPSYGLFSVFAWIKGGSPGQVIISQLDGNGTGEAWLCTDTSNGNLMTALVPQKIGRDYPQPLISGSIITDGQWHYIGFVWDGSYRILYVDGIEVAKDTAAQNPLKNATGGLYIGTSKTLSAGTFFSGLIDDIRIYNQALSAEQIAALAK